MMSRNFCDFSNIFSSLAFIGPELLN